MWEMINPFPHTTILQQTTLNIFCQEIENLYNWMDNLWLKVENIVAKGEIARFEQFLLLSLCFQKCRGVRKRLYEGKGYVPKMHACPRTAFTTAYVKPQYNTKYRYAEIRIKPSLDVSTNKVFKTINWYIKGICLKVYWHFPV